MAEFKKEIPFQSDTSDFNSFFGFKINMTMGEALFKAASYGFDIVEAFQDKNKVTFWLERKGTTLCSCGICGIYLTFIKPFVKRINGRLVFDNSLYFLICAEVVVEKNNADAIGSLLADYLSLESRYHLVDKNDYYFYRPAKINIQLQNCDDDNIASIMVSKKKARHVDEQEFHFWLKFLDSNNKTLQDMVDISKIRFMLKFLFRESGEVFFHPKLTDVYNNYSGVSGEDKELLCNLAIGVMHIGQKGNAFYNQEYFELWCYLCEFWAENKNWDKVFELARKIKKLFDDSDPENSEKTKKLIVKTIKDMKTSIEIAKAEKEKAKKEEKKAKKEEEKKLKEEQINKLSQSLDDL